MSVGKKENILSDTIHIPFFWLVVENFEVHGCKKFGAAEGATRVAALCTMHHAYNVPPDLGAKGFYLFSGQKRRF